ncbi:MAG TPA: hypothetical protein VG798_04075, partial [Rhizomicrobium sp.]|nr:hypothetical protein [Rhizomicrobium sp.]
YIGDNVLIGRHDPAKMMGWSGTVWASLPGFPELLISEYAIKVYGQGHVVTHNYFANWHDAVDVATYGEPDGTPNMASPAVSGPTEMDDRLAASIDFYRNDIYNMGDNCIEADGGVHNIRVFENRCSNSAAAALSAQPIFGGPVYFYRNLVYNSVTGGPLKYADGPSGVLVYQNTFIGGDTAPGGPVGNMHVRNNLFLGRGDDAPVYAIDTTTNYSSSDYNGFNSNRGSYDFVWDSPPSGQAADFDYTHKLTQRRFKSLKEYAAATGQDKHSVVIDYGSLMRVQMPDNSDPQHLYDPENMDFRLRPKSPAVDAGMALPTITDGYKGSAPDLGAYELGDALPDYGPRSMPPGAPIVDKMGLRSWNGPAGMTPLLPK